MKYLIFSTLSIFFSSVLYGNSAPTPSEFRPGQTWVWNYYQVSDGTEELYSIEKYDVVDIEGDTVTIQMSTRMPEQSEFLPHHRIKASLQECVKSYRYAHVGRPWQISMFNRQGNEWKKAWTSARTEAFEEKFNCNPHGSSSRMYDFESKEFFVDALSTSMNAFSYLPRPGRNPRSLGSWFASGSNELQGVVVQKTFPNQPDGSYYYFKLARFEN